MRLLSLACLLTTLLRARAAFAGTTMVQRMADGAKVTLYAEGTRVRLQNLMGNNEDFGVILDVRTRGVVFVDDGLQAYFDVASFVKRSRKKVAPMQRALRRQMSQSDGKVVAYVPSREKRTIAGLPCEMFQGFQDGRVVREICAAPWGDPAIGAAKDYALFDAAMGLFVDTIYGTRQAADGSYFYRLAEGPGLDLWSQGIDADRTRGPVTELVSLRHEPIPAAIFSVPEGYQESESVLDSDERARPTPSAPVPVGAPEAASSSNNDARRVTGIIAVLLFVVGTLALLFHSWLLHLAAGFVLAEPRYINAIVATLILWVAFVPLSLLGVPLLIALPVELLAAYGGLKLSYRESTARTVALLVVSAIVALLVQLAWAFMSGAFRR